MNSVQEPTTNPRVPPLGTSIGLIAFSLHQFLRFVFDWGHETEFRASHALVSALLLSAGAAVARIPLARRELLFTVHCMVGSLPIFALLCLPPPSGPWSPFAATVRWGLMLPFGALYGALARGLLSRQLAHPTPLRNGAAGKLAALSRAAWPWFPLGALLQFLLGSLPGVFTGHFWEAPSAPHVEFQVWLWRAELAAWGLSLSLFAVALAARGDRQES